MKKFLALLLALVMTLSLVACGGDTPANNENTDNDGAQTVGISMPTKSLERWNRDGSYLKEQFEKAGYNVLLTYSDNDNNQQNNDIANMLAENIDLLIVAAIDGEALAQTLADAKDQNVPVIAYDRMITNSDAVNYYVSFDNYTVGVLQAQYVIDKLDLANAGDKTYNIEFTAGDPADNNAGFFFNGAYDTLKTYIDAGTLKIPSGKTTFEQVATPAWSTDTAMENFQNTLASYYSDGTVLDIALCSNDSTAMGVAKAITSDYAGSNTPLVTGQDGDIANLQNIVDGVQTMTVYKNVADEAGVTLVLAQALPSCLHLSEVHPPPCATNSLSRLPATPPTTPTAPLPPPPSCWSPTPSMPRTCSCWWIPATTPGTLTTSIWCPPLPDEAVQAR